MKVSVIMPTRNPGVYFKPALESILSQDHAAIELLVVDDGCTDGSRELALALGDARVHVITGPQRGIAACLNTGLRQASGELVMRCDADDVYPAGRVRAQAAWLAARPGHAAVCGPFSTIDARGEPVAQLWKGALREEEDISPALCTGARAPSHLCSFGIRRSAIAAVGGFREFFETAEDIDFTLRLAEVGPIGYLASNSYFYRLHSASITHTQANPRRIFFETTAFAFARERAATGTDALAAGNPPAPPTDRTDQTPRDAAAATRRQIQGMLVGAAWHHLAEGRRQEACGSALRAVTKAPWSMDSWRCLLLVSWRARRS